MNDNSFVVPASLVGDRVDRAVAFHTGWTRAEVQTIIDDRGVRVDDREVAKSYRLHEGETVVIVGAPAVEAMPVGEPMDLDIVYEDPHVVVVMKPPGLVVHPGNGNETATLVNGLLDRYPEIVDVGDRTRPGIVHRLDRETSGLLVVARSQLAFDSLIAQMAERRVERRYDALCWGQLTSPRGVIDAPIGRSQTRRTRMAIRDDGRDARTHYEVISYWRMPGVSYLECVLETGRTHQIRVHLNAIGHPIVGDATYRGYRESISLKRPFLHARVLGFEHPLTGEAMRFERSITPDLEAVIAWLGARDETGL